MFKSDQDDDFVNKIENFYSDLAGDDKYSVLMRKIKATSNTTNVSARAICVGLMESVAEIFKKFG
jgi:hypothetical protein